MAAHFILDCQNFKFLVASRIGKTMHITVPNFIEIGQVATELNCI